MSGWHVPEAASSLRHRDYRLFWLGGLISNSGDWMDQVALNWLVYEMTSSTVALGFLNLCRLGPMLLFTVVGGAVADRLERRRLLMVTQTVATLLAAALAALVLSGRATYELVLLIAVGRGVMFSFNQPARQSLIATLVPRQDLRNAVAINSATFNLARVLGPSLGGLLIVVVGSGGVFAVNALSFIPVLWTLALLRSSQVVPRARASLMADTAGGLRYLAGHQRLRTLIALALVPALLGMPYLTLITVFSRDVLHVGSVGLGLLTSSVGVGAVGGALYIGAASQQVNLTRLMIGGLAGLGTALLVYAFSPWLVLSALALVVAGVCQQVYAASNQTLIHTHVDDAYRGRVFGILMMNRAMVPLGTTIAGFVAALVGIQLTQAGLAALLLGFTLLVTRRALPADTTEVA